MFFVAKTNTAGVQVTFAVKEVLRLSTETMTRMYQSASLFAWSPPTVIRHHTFYFVVVLFYRDKNGPFLVNYAILTVAETRPHTLHFYPMDGYFLTYHTQA